MYLGHETFHPVEVLALVQIRFRQVSQSPLFRNLVNQVVNLCRSTRRRFAHQRTVANGGFSVFPQPQQTHGLSLPTQLFSYPAINRIQTTNDPSAFIYDTTTDDFPNNSSPAIARQCFRLRRLSHTHRGSPPRRSIPQWVVGFLAVRVPLFEPSADFFFVASEHRTVSLQPNGAEFPSVREDTSATPALLPRKPCRFTT